MKPCAPVSTQFSTLGPWQGGLKGLGHHTKWTIKMNRFLNLNRLISKAFLAWFVNCNKGESLFLVEIVI